MNVYVMRHGQASSFAPTDEERPLTDIGREQAFAQGEWLKAQGVNLTHIAVSPYLRAQQTFEELNRAYGGKLNAETTEELTPYGHSEKIAQLVDAWQAEGAENVLFISHLPLVGEIVTNLTARQQRATFMPATLAELTELGTRYQLVQVKPA